MPTKSGGKATPAANGNEAAKHLKTEPKKAAPAAKAKPAAKK